MHAQHETEQGKEIMFLVYTRKNTVHTASMDAPVLGSITL